MCRRVPDFAAAFDLGFGRCQPDVGKPRCVEACQGAALFVQGEKACEGLKKGYATLPRKWLFRADAGG